MRPITLAILERLRQTREHPEIVQRVICASKVVFATAPAAWKAAECLNRRHAKHRRPPARAYRCEMCDGWHLTSSEPPRGRSRPG